MYYAWTVYPTIQYNIPEDHLKL